jgi:hypothetical protein
MSAVTSVYLLGPVLLSGAVATLGASLRWLLTEPVSQPPRPPATDDYGLLRAVAVVEDLDLGQSVRALLVAARVRATVATGRDGLVRVLVFPSEYDRARRLVSWAL